MSSEMTPQNRLDLVKDDTIRKVGQIVLAFFMIGGMFAYLGWYLMTQADPVFQNMVAIGMFTLASGGIGAALAIFGLGRTVGGNRR